MKAAEITAHFLESGDIHIARHAQGFFKTGIGKYGAGDKFIGIRVPVIRARVKALSPLPLDTITQLIRSEFHEIRLFATLALVENFNRADEAGREEICHLYLANHAFINNWDIVDCSAHKIVGPYLLNRSRDTLHQLAKNGTLWQRRVAYTNQYKKVIYSEFFWQTNSRRMDERMVIPSEVIQHRSRQPKILLKGEF